MKPIYLTFLYFLVLSTLTYAQSTHKQEALVFQEELNAQYKNPDESPLLKKDFKTFKGHHFFPINDSLRIVAKFIKIETPKTLLLKTTTSRLPKYDTYGIAEFQMNNKSHRLYIYQSHTSRESEKYKDYLFLPFTDLTNGKETYGGGRYVDIKISDINEDTVIIDFNKSYNPYCVYNYKYSCVIPPEDNDLAIEIKAGVKNYK